MGPHTLSQVLRHIPVSNDPRLMVGLDTSDDAAVYKLNGDQALIQTVDFFTPMVDDPYLYGQIAAANALSDIYAMGGKPLLALNIVCFPDCLPHTVLEEILRGGAEKVQEAGGITAGGHTVRDAEPKYGLTVTGLARPEQITSNAGAKAGDLLVLTKPLGTGIIITGIKAELVSEAALREAGQSMSALNRKASEAMLRHGANACTDITGFGLLGHASEMAGASGVILEIDYSSLPLLPETMDMARMGLIPGGAYDNREHLRGRVEVAERLKPEEQMLLYDPQTSGGLLVSIPAPGAEKMIGELARAGIQAAIIGRVLPREEKLIRVLPGDGY